MNHEYYLVNPIYNNFVDKKLITKKDSDYKKEDIVFYKKRINQMIKNCMHNKNVPINIKDSFTEYLKLCIEHFKSEDRNEMMQNEYNDLLLENKKINDVDIDIDKTNKELYIKKEVTIENCLPLEIKKIKKEESTNYPKQKDLNLKDKRFKTKGIKKKNKKNNMDNI
tara:strand:+ start:2304 stop:2804 length:501 start_codon:yes stop_codon:yes gene_type:complete